MGMIIASNVVRTVYSTDPQPCGFIFAASQAVLSRSFLTWAPLGELQKIFADRITMDHSIVTLKGPVLVMPSVAKAVSATRIFAFYSGLLVGALMYQGCTALKNYFISSIKGTPNAPAGARKAPSSNERFVVKHMPKIIAAIGAGLTMYMTASKLSNILPKEPGIYFYSNNYYSLLGLLLGNQSVQSVL